MPLFPEVPLCYGDCICQYMITKILFHPIADSACVVIKSIQADYTVCNTFCQNGSHLLINCGSKLKLWLRGVDTVTSSNGVWTNFCIFPLRRLSHLTFFFCRMCIHLIFKAAFRILSNKGGQMRHLFFTKAYSLLAVQWSCS